MTTFLSVKKSNASRPCAFRSPKNEPLAPPNPKNDIGAATPMFTPVMLASTLYLKSRACFPRMGAQVEPFDQDAAAETLERILDIDPDHPGAREHRDGLTTESMGIRGIAGWYVRNFMNKDDAMKESFRKQGVEKVAKQAAEGGGWFIITSEGESVFDLIDTGRRFERMALLARERNISVHPMTQWLEEKAGQEEIAKNHPPGVMPQFVLRVGYLGRYPEPVSLRRPVSWFVRT